MQHKRTLALILAMALLLGCGGYVPAMAAESGTANHLTWASSNEDVATVNTNGLVSCLRAGNTTITATCTDNAGNPLTASCDLWVKVADGVYYIQNAASGLCLVNAESEESTANVNISAKNTTNETKASEFWEITYTNAGFYVIRPISRMLSVLTVNTNSGRAIVKDYETDAFIQFADRWKIFHEDSGYAFLSSGLTANTMMPEDTNTEGTRVTTDPGTTSPNCHWTLGVAKGVVLRDTSTQRAVTSSTTKTIELGDTVSLSEIGLYYETYGGAIMGVTYGSSNSTFASVNNGSSIITACGIGEPLITLYVNIDGTGYTSAFTCVVQPDTAILLALIHSDGGDRSKYFVDTEQHLETEVNYKYTQTTTTSYTSYSIGDMIDILQCYDHFIIHTHGVPQGFQIDADAGDLTMNDLNGIDLSNLRFALLLTCNTASNFDPIHITNNTPVNITEQLVICGAETVIGFAEPTYVDDCNEFVCSLTELIYLYGFSIEDALSLINCSEYIDTNFMEIVEVAGNTSAVFR